MGHGKICWDTAGHAGARRSNLGQCWNGKHSKLQRFVCVMKMLAEGGTDGMIGSLLENSGREQPAELATAGLQLQATINETDFCSRQKERKAKHGCNGPNSAALVPQTRLQPMVSWRDPDTHLHMDIYSYTVSFKSKDIILT